MRKRSAKLQTLRPIAGASLAALDWGDLQHFVMLCEAGSVSAAAAALRVHHATVLRRVAALEAALSTPLLELSGGRYVRTTAGNELMASLSGMPQRLSDAPRHLEDHDGDVSGEIRLTSTDTLVRSMLTPLIETFCARHPGVHVRIVVDNNFLSLTRRDADVAIRGSNRPPQNLVGRRVGDIQTAPYASRVYLKALRRRPPLSQLDWIAPDDSLAHLEQAKWLVRSVPVERVVMTVDSLVGMLHAVEQGIGAAMLLCPLGDANPALVRLAEPDSALDTQIWILTHPGLRQVARVRAFSQFMFDALSRDPRLVHGGSV